MRRLSRSIAGVVGADSLVCDCAFGGYLLCHCNCLTAQQDLSFSFRRKFGLLSRFGTIQGWNGTLDETL